MKKLFLILTVCISFFFVSCNQNQGGQVTVNESQPSVGQNLDLKALGELVKQCSNPQEIEQKLNADNSINNLDLDGDGNRDYLKVTEFGEGTQHGYSITDVQKDGEPEVATINVNVQNSTMQLNGNPTYYGNMNNSYQSSFTTTDFLLLTWMMQPHYSYYRSPYHYGYYGYGYRPMRVLPYRSYYSNPYVSSSRTKTTYKTTTTRSTIKSPNSSNTSKSVSNHVSLSNPTHSQKSFSTRNTSSPIRSGGFNSKPSSSSHSYSSPSHSSSSSHSYSSPSHSSSWGHSSSSSSHSSFHSSGSHHR